jgi:hypothetical protein
MYAVLQRLTRRIRSVIKAAGQQSEHKPRRLVTVTVTVGRAQVTVLSPVARASGSESRPGPRSVRDSEWQSLSVTVPVRVRAGAESAGKPITVPVPAAAVETSDHRAWPFMTGTGHGLTRTWGQAWPRAGRPAPGSAKF